MANLIVTFTMAGDAGESGIVLERGDLADTEVVEITDAGEVSSKSAAGAKHVLRLAAEDDCWVDIGQDPSPAPGTGRKLFAGDTHQFYVTAGDKVGVISDTAETAT